ncbi:MAG: EAL domain-containing protein [Magnetococcales bacterium]|nr:EAL domain-containing protein [Magnetococcales bacterium]
MQRLRQTHRYAMLVVLGLTTLSFLVVLLGRELLFPEMVGMLLLPVVVSLLLLRHLNHVLQSHEQNRLQWMEEIEHSKIQLEQRVRERTQELTSLNWALQNEVNVRRHAEHELSLAASVYRNSGEGIVILDAQGRIRSVNAAFANTSGYSLDELEGKEWTLLKSAQHDADFCQMAYQTLLTNDCWRGEVWCLKKTGDLVPEFLHVSTIRDSNGLVQHYVAVANDLTELTQARKQVEFLAHYDALTGLPNRSLLLDRMHQAFSYAQRFEQLVAVMLLGLDRFKLTNELLGRKSGDQLLREVADRIRHCVREEDSVARLSGDEFVILATGLPDVNTAAKVASKIMQAFETPFMLGTESHPITASMGMTVYPFDQGDPSHYLQCAGSAMAKAKESGGGHYRYYTQEMGVVAEKRLAMERGLRYALEREELFLYYQPQIDVISGRVVGVEALIRWKNRELGLVSPAQFIPLAEESNLIIAIGEWVLRTACSQAVAWRQEGFAPIRVAVNLSARQFQHPGLMESVESALRDTGLEAHYLELELTEGLFMGNLNGLVSLLETIEKKGLLLSIDDFGTGYSSLSYLKKFPVHTLKIDQAFIRDIIDDPDDAAITRTIIAMAKNLNLQVVAEGVASVEQLEFLRTLGCDIVQGFLFSPPVPPEEITLFLEEDQTIRPDQKPEGCQTHATKAFSSDGKVIPFPGRPTGLPTFTFEEEQGTLQTDNKRG